MWTREPAVRFPTAAATSISVIPSLMSARRISTERLELVTATAQHLLVQLEDPEKLGRLIAAKVPSGWPPELLDEKAVRFTLERLHKGPEQIGWWMRYVILRKGGEGRTLIGTVGLHGLPDNGALEVGYSILEEFRGEGYATEALTALMTWAFEQDEVDQIRAHTLADGDASQRVLTHLGFQEAGEGDEPDTMRFIKTKEAWLEELPPEARIPKIVPQPSSAPITGIPAIAKDVYDKLLREPLREVEDLRAEVLDYVAYIEIHAGDNPYVDDILARDIARVCEGLFDAVLDTTPEHTRRQIQAAARYFVTEEDGDSDLVIGGLDEDAAVANAVAEHLGRGDLVSDAL